MSPAEAWEVGGFLCWLGLEEWGAHEQTLHGLQDTLQRKTRSGRQKVKCRGGSGDGEWDRDIDPEGRIRSDVLSRRKRDGPQALVEEGR